MMEQQGLSIISKVSSAKALDKDGNSVFADL